LEGAFSPDGSLFAQCSNIEDTLRLSIWDVSGGKELHRIHGSGDARRVSVFSPSNRYLAIGELNGNLRVVELASGRKISFEGHKQFPYTLAFSPDEKRLATGGYDSSVKLWDVTTGKRLADFPVEGGRFSCIAFSPDGRRVVAGSASSHGKGGGIVRVWDLESMREVAIRTAHVHSVLGVAFLDDDTLVSLSRDSLRLWRAPKMEEIAMEEAVQAGSARASRTGVTGPEDSPLSPAPQTHSSTYQTFGPKATIDRTGSH
jgi:WD40 repeat protein